MWPPGRGEVGECPARRGRGATPCSPSRLAEAVGRAGAVGGRRRRGSRRRAAARAGARAWTPSPTTGSQPAAATVATSGPSGATVTRPRRRVGVGEQPVERRGAGWGSVVGVVDAPGLRQRAGEVGLLGEDVGGAVAHAAGLDEQHLSASAASRSNRTPLVARRATAARTPCRRRSGPRPGAPTARGPTAAAATRASARARTSSVGSSSRHGKISTSARSTVERWSATENSVRRSTSSPHRSMRTGASAVRREHVDDRAAHRDLAAVLDLVLAAVADAHEPLDELGRVDLVAGADDDRLDVGDVRAEPLHEGPDRGDHDPRAPARGRAGATGCAAGGPWSRPRG